MAVIAIILVAAVALGAVAWVVTGLTSTGSVTVTETPNYAYTVSPQILDFGSQSVGQGIYYEASDTVAIVNTGNQAIGGWVIDITSGALPTGVDEIVYDGYNVPISVGGTGSIIFIVKGTPANAGTIDLSGLTFNLTPAP